MIEFRVDGEPQEWPKKVINTTDKFGFRRDGSRYAIPTVKPRDPKRTKTRWKNQVKNQAWLYMLGCKQDYIKKPQAIAIEVRLYRTQPKSNKNPYPSTRPDGDNYFYLVHNVLEGICYDNDGQLVDYQEYKRWADADHPPGIEVILQTMEEKNGRET